MLTYKSFDEIVEEITDRYSELQKEAGLDYVANVNDDISLLTEAFSYRLSLLLADFDHTFKNLFLENASGGSLDLLANNFFGIKRLPGTKPRSVVTFGLVNKVAPGQRATFNERSIFVSSSGARATLVREVVIPEGDKEAKGVLELDEYVETSDVKTDISLQNLSFDYTVSFYEKDEDDNPIETQFSGGVGPEGDIALRERCLTSLHLPSTAGSRNSYIYHTKTADSRIEQVAAYNYTELEANAASSDERPCEVFIAFYAPVGDPDDIKENVEKRLNAPDVKPLGIKVNVAPAVVKRYDIAASIALIDGSDKGFYEEQIERQARENLNKLKVLGGSVTRYQISNMLGLSDDPNIKTVSFVLSVNGNTLAEGIEEITCDLNEIAVLGALTPNVIALGDSIVT